MKLNDPFGRVGRRQEASYAALKAQLIAEGIDQVSAVDAVMQRMTRMALLFMTITIGVTLLAGLLFAPWWGLVGVLGGITLLWLSATLFRTRTHLRRYRRELSREAAAHRDNPHDNKAPGGSEP